MEGYPKSPKYLAVWFMFFKDHSLSGETYCKRLLSACRNTPHIESIYVIVRDSHSSSSPYQCRIDERSLHQVIDLHIARAGSMVHLKSEDFSIFTISVAVTTHPQALVEEDLDTKRDPGLWPVIPWPFERQMHYGEPVVQSCAGLHDEAKDTCVLYKTCNCHILFTPVSLVSCSRRARIELNWIRRCGGCAMIAYKLIRGRQPIELHAMSAFANQRGNITYLTPFKALDDHLFLKRSSSTYAMCNDHLQISL